MRILLKGEVKILSHRILIVGRSNNYRPSFELFLEFVRTVTTEIVRTTGGNCSNDKK